MRAMIEKRAVLVLVHPGSACGSADFNLGYDIAAIARGELVNALDAWRGPVVVIDGALSDELPRYCEFHRAIAEALDRAGAEGRRVMACDADGETYLGAPRAIEALRLDPARDAIVVTGCWFDPDGPDGCVNAVAEGFAAAGFEIRIDAESAVADPNSHDVASSMKP